MKNHKSHRKSVETGKENLLFTQIYHFIESWKTRKIVEKPAENGKSNLKAVENWKSSKRCRSRRFVLQKVDENQETHIFSAENQKETPYYLPRLSLHNGHTIDIYLVFCS